MYFFELLYISKNVYICKIISYFKKYRGIHPGKILERELKKRSIRQRPFAISLGEYPQTFNAIIRGKRGISTALALKIEKELDLEEGTIVILQAYYDIKKAKDEIRQTTPDLTILNKSLFWDTDIDKIDWQRQFKAVILRVFERGNDKDKNEIRRYYGEKKIEKVLNEANGREAYRIYRRDNKID